MKISEIIKTKNGYVFIDTCSLDNEFGNILNKTGFGNPNAVTGEYETMVFKCDKKGKVKDWLDLDVTNYPTEEKAKKGHKKMITKWKNK